jgi:phospholipid transport system substrate-binding protein
MSANLRRYGTVALATIAVLVMTALASPARAADAAPAAQGPRELIDTVAHQVLSELSANREELRKDPSKVRKLVDKLLLPHFDTENAAKQVLAQHWRDATPDQRQHFIAAFYQSLLQNYGEALLDFTPDRITIYPFRGDPADKSASVRTDIRRDNGSRVPVSYTLRKTDAGWKAWDVTIEGISYVKSFRTDFASEIDQRGLDAVIKRLETQQAAGKIAKPANKG